jgi:hypothetical protein
MRPINDVLDKAWRLHDRGIITRAEIMNQFWDEIVYSDADAVATFCGLSERSQSLVKEYLQTVKPEEMPPLLYLGDVTEERIQDELAKRIARARAISAFLESQP